MAYRVPGAPTADWVDIYNRLYRERIIFLGQEIDDELANQIIGVLLVCVLSGFDVFGFYFAILSILYAVDEVYRGRFFLFRCCQSI